ncbi:MAG TPA: fumarylacetoacetate hydrolase family protein [Kofleriaceae bacterium]|nr:fumarylacetoacetate hydrolase family protein [Kofleriaceae bacterium]
MERHRRSFLKVVGAIGAAAAARVGLSTPSAMAAPGSGAARTAPRGLARGLTLLTMRQGGEDRLGVVTRRGVLDVAAAAPLLRMTAPTTMDELLHREQGAALNALVDAALRSGGAVQRAFLAERAIEYGPLVARPEKIVCVGLNYRRHALEVHMPIPKQPVLFNKYNNALNRHNGSIKLPVAMANKFDHEVELVIVMGREARNVSEADAHSYVAGYATGNDFTARDLQLETGGQWMIGKTPDQFAPLGPHLVTADQVDPDRLDIECRVNGETRQSSSTRDFIFNTRQVISYISRTITLRPGDIIFTGTPEGVIQGKPPEKRVWLKPGDKIACSVQKLGELKFDLV